MFPDGREIAGEIIRGEAEAWEVIGRGYMVTRLEINPAHKTLVIVAGQGRDAGPVFDVLPAIARANGADTIRIHSLRPGMLRVLSRRGYQSKIEDRETVYTYGIEKQKQISQH